MIAIRDMRDTSNALRNHPMCVTYIKILDTNDWTEYHRTETSWNVSEAKFVKKVVLPHLPGRKRFPLRFMLYADDASSGDGALDAKNFLGYAEANLEEVIEAGEVSGYSHGGAGPDRHLHLGGGSSVPVGNFSGGHCLKCFFRGRESKSV